MHASWLRKYAVARRFYQRLNRNVTPARDRQPWLNVPLFGRSACLWTESRSSVCLYARTYLIEACDFAHELIDELWINADHASCEPEEYASALDINDAVVGTSRS